MKLIYYDGCTSNSISVDNEDLEDLPRETKLTILNKIIDKCDDNDIIAIIRDYIESHGKFEDSYVCEQCGDSCFTYSLTL